MIMGLNFTAKKGPQGFTFLELMIALTIFSIMAVSIYSVLGAGIRVWRGSNAIIESNQSLRSFFDAISSDLKNAVKYKGMEFEGQAREMSFMALVDVSDPVKGSTRTELAKVIYSFDESSKTVKRYVATRESGFDKANTEGVDIVSRIEDVNFSYCYKDETLIPPYRWQDAWQAQGIIPRGVNIKIKELEKRVFIPMGELVKTEETGGG